MASGVGASMVARRYAISPRLVLGRWKVGRVLPGAKGVMSKVARPSWTRPPVDQPRAWRVGVIGGRWRWCERVGRRIWER